MDLHGLDKAWISFNSPQFGAIEQYERKELAGGWELICVQI